MSGIAIHLGIVPHFWDEPAGVALFNAERPTFEDSISEVVLSADERIYTAGSWSCWNEADQANSPDGSAATLHIVQLLGDWFVPSRAGLLVRTAALRARVEPWIQEGRLADYAVISDADDWSEQQQIITWDGHNAYPRR